MKVAITISGQPRKIYAGFKECKKYFLDKYDCDVYLHGWKDKTFHKYDFFNEGKLQNVYKPSENTYKNILNWYKPKKHLFEKGIQFDATDIKGYNNQRLNSQMGMFLSLKRVWDLVEESGIKYDYIIRTRYDLLFTHHVAADSPFLNDITQLDPNYVNTFGYSNQKTDPLNMDDRFAIGGYDVMKTYHNLFPTQIYYHFEDPKYDEWLTNLDKFVNETIIYYHCNEHYLPIAGIIDGNLDSNSGPKVIR